MPQPHAAGQEPPPPAVEEPAQDAARQEQAPLAVRQAVRDMRLGLERYFTGLTNQAQALLRARLPPPATTLAQYGPEGVDNLVAVYEAAAERNEGASVERTGFGPLLRQYAQNALESGRGDQTVENALLAVTQLYWIADLGQGLPPMLAPGPLENNEQRGYERMSPLDQGGLKAFQTWLLKPHTQMALLGIRQTLEWADKVQQRFSVRARFVSQALVFGATAGYTALRLSGAVEGLPGGPNAANQIALATQAGFAALLDTFRRGAELSVPLIPGGEVRGRLNAAMAASGREWCQPYPACAQFYKGLLYIIILWPDLTRLWDARGRPSGNAAEMVMRQLPTRVAAAGLQAFGHPSDPNVYAADAESDLAAFATDGDAWSLEEWLAFARGMATACAVMESSAPPQLLEDMQRRFLRLGEVPRFAGDPLLAGAMTFATQVQVGNLNIVGMEVVMTLVLALGVLEYQHRLETDPSGDAGAPVRAIVTTVTAGILISQITNFSVLIGMQASLNPQLLVPLAFNLGPLLDAFFDRTTRTTRVNAGVRQLFQNLQRVIPPQIEAGTIRMLPQHAPAADPAELAGVNRNRVFAAIGELPAQITIAVENAAAWQERETARAWPAAPRALQPLQGYVLGGAPEEEAGVAAARAAGERAEAEAQMGPEEQLDGPQEAAAEEQPDGPQDEMGDAFDVD